MASSPEKAAVLRLRSGYRVRNHSRPPTFLGVERDKMTGDEYVPLGPCADWTRVGTHRRGACPNKASIVVAGKPYCGTHARFLLRDYRLTEDQAARALDMMEQDFGVERIAREIGVSPNHLNRWIDISVGEAPAFEFEQEARCG